MNNITLILFLLLSLSLSAQEKISYIRVPAGSEAEISRLLRLGINLEDGRAKAGRFVEIYSTPFEREQLERNGIPYTVLIPDWNEHFNRLLEQEASVTQMPVTPAGIASVRNFRLGSMRGIMTFSQAMAELDSMRRLYPTLVSQNDTIGFSYEKRPIIAVKLSRNPEMDENEPRLLYNSLTHAREGGGLMTLLYFMWYLLENYNVSPMAQAILDNRELWFVPVVNPDGYLHNQTTNPNGGGMWRKNRGRHQPDTTQVGIDLNRNFGFQWGYDDEGSSPLPTAATYRGPAAFSEPETRAIRDFCIEKNFSFALNYHTYSNLLIYPWGFSDSDTRDSLYFRMIGTDMTSRNRYTYGTGGQTVGYVTNGDADDWMYGDTISKPLIYAMTPEVGSSMDGFWPASARVLPLAAENLHANLYIAQAGGLFLALDSVRASEEFPTGQFTISFTFVNKGLLSPSSPVQIAFTSRNGSVQILDPVVTSADWKNAGTITIRCERSPASFAGERIVLDASLNYEKGYASDSLAFRLGPATLVFADDAEKDTLIWNLQGGFARTQRLASSGSYAYADNVMGAYADKANATMTLLRPLDLSAFTRAELQFSARWYIETNYDFASAEISTDNGVTWTRLSGRYTALADGVGAQRPAGTPLYEGVKHEFVRERMDLTPWAGRNNVLIRFAFGADDFVTFEGFTIDDIALYGFGNPVQATGSETIPEHFALEQNFPNPFNPHTHIRFSLPRAAEIRLTLHDILGRELQVVARGVYPAGTHREEISAQNLSSGTYFYTLTAEGFRASKRMTVIR